MILYMHPHLGKGRATAAIDISDLDSIKVAFAFCSPKDQFNRKLGRQIATGRLDAGVVHMEFADDKAQAVKAQVATNLEEDIMAELEYLPHWANELSRAW